MCPASLFFNSAVYLHGIPPLLLTGRKINLHIKRSTLHDASLKNTTLSEQFQNKILKLQKEAQSIPLTQIHDRSISWVGTGTFTKVAGLK
jgi:hypothetical protein